MSDIKMEFVQSSQINAMGFKDDVMAVQFRNGAVYHYEGVTQALFDAVVGSDSVGKAFIAVIRDNYEGVKQ